MDLMALEIYALLSPSLNTITINYFIARDHFLQKSLELSLHVCSILGSSKEQESCKCITNDGD